VNFFIQFFLLTLLGSSFLPVFADSTIDTSAYSLTIPVLLLLSLLTLLSVYFGFKLLCSIHVSEPTPIASIDNFRMKVVSAGILLLIILIYVIGSVYFRYNAFSLPDSLFGYLTEGYRIGRPSYLLIVNFVATLLITILVEASVAFALGIRGKNKQKSLIAVNLISNPLLNFALLGFGLFSAIVSSYGDNTAAFFMSYLKPFYFVIFLEFIVTLFEFLLVKNFIGNSGRYFAKILLINLTSFVYGTLIAQILTDTVYMLPMYLERTI